MYASNLLSALFQNCQAPTGLIRMMSSRGISHTVASYSQTDLLAMACQGYCLTLLYRINAAIVSQYCIVSMQRLSHNTVHGSSQDTCHDHTDDSVCPLI